MRHLLKKTDNFIGGLSPLILGSFLIVLTLLLGLIDYLTGQELSFSIFYIVPVFLAAWYGSKSLGLLISFISSLVWLVADHTSGHEYSHTIILIWNSSVRLTLFSIISILLSVIRQKLILEEQLADTDPLTDLSNRRHFLECLELESMKLQRYKHPLTLAYIDLDNFKSVNDTMGHDIGDTVLQTVASIIQENIRKTDLAARLGGDEFATLFSMANYEEADIILNKLHSQLQNAMDSHHWPITFSIGMITCEESIGSTRDLLKSADDLMYIVKKSGKNSIIHQKLGGGIIDQ